MIRKILYRYQRPDGGYTVTPVKPEGSDNILWRLIAEEGMAITHGETTVTVSDVIHRSDCEAWTDVERHDELKHI